jgi:hypothetical protein
MNIKYYLMFLISVSCLSSCISQEAFQPPPPSYTYWTRLSDSVEDVKRAMLECGYPTPFSADVSITTDEEVAKMQRCMEKSGFIHKGNFGTFCQQYTALQACQFNAVIPERSVQRRLESRFCKKYPKADVCQP